MMTEGKYYSVKDLANLTGENKGTTDEIVRFLAKYGFIEQAGSDDSVFTKSKIIISPAKSIELLKALVQSAI